MREFEKIARESMSRLKRVAYDGKRGDRPSGQRIDARPVGGHFVVVDSEGVVLGEKKVAATKTHGKETRVTQRTCLWMAGGAEGYQDQMLEDVAETAFRRSRFSNSCFRCRENSPRPTRAPNSRFSSASGFPMTWRKS